LGLRKLKEVKATEVYTAGGGRRELYANFAGEATQFDPAVVDEACTARTSWVTLSACRLTQNWVHDTPSSAILQLARLMVYRMADC